MVEEKPVPAEIVPDRLPVAETRLERSPVPERLAESVPVEAILPCIAACPDIVPDSVPTEEMDPTTSSLMEDVTLASAAMVEAIAPLAARVAEIVEVDDTVDDILQKRIPETIESELTVDARMPLPDRVPLTDARLVMDADDPSDPEMVPDRDDVDATVEAILQ